MDTEYIHSMEIHFESTNMVIGSSVDHFKDDQIPSEPFESILIQNSCSQRQLTTSINRMPLGIHSLPGFMLNLVLACVSATRFSVNLNLFFCLFL